MTTPDVLSIPRLGPDESTEALIPSLLDFVTSHAPLTKESPRRRCVPPSTFPPLSTIANCTV